MEGIPANRRSVLNSFRVEEDFTQRQILRVLCAASVYVLMATFLLCLFFTYNVNPILNPSLDTAQIGDPSLLSFPSDFETQWRASAEMRDALMIWLTGILGMTGIFAVATGLVFSRKLAGPIHRLKTDLAHMKNGAKVFPIVLRDGDELHELTAILNETLATVSSRQSEGSASGSKQFATDETMACLDSMRNHLAILTMSTTATPQELADWTGRMTDLIRKAESSQSS